MGKKVNRRTEQRVNWNDPVQYRIWRSGEYKTGILKNISIHGALLWLKEELDVGDRLEMLTGSFGKQQLTQMRVVRKEYTSDEYYASYGCRVEARTPIAA